MREEHYIDCFVYELELTSRTCHEVFKRWFEKNTSSLLSIEEFTIMDTIDCNKNLSQIELAQTILKGKAHTGKFLDTLEEKGYITRIYDTKNSRMVKIPVMTDLGQEIYTKMRRQLKGLADISDKILTAEEEKDFIKTLKNFRIKINEIETISFK